MSPFRTFLAALMIVGMVGVAMYYPHLHLHWPWHWHWSKP